MSSAPVHSYALPAELTVHAAAQTHAALCSLVDDAGASGALHIDGSRVAEVDSCGIQLLVSLQAGLAAQGAGLHVHSSSELLAGACRLLGQTSLLNSQGHP